MPFGCILTLTLANWKFHKSAFYSPIVCAIDLHHRMQLQTTVFVVAVVNLCALVWWIFFLFTLFRWNLIDSTLIIFFFLLFHSRFDTFNDSHTHTVVIGVCDGEVHFKQLNFFLFFFFSLIISRIVSALSMKMLDGNSRFFRSFFFFFQLWLPIIFVSFIQRSVNCVRVFVRRFVDSDNFELVVLIHVYFILYTL